MCNGALRLDRATWLVGEPTIQHAPECGDGFYLFVEEVFEETWFVKQRRI